MMIKNKSQAILGYALLIAVVIAAIIAMSVYIKRRIQGSYKKSADVFGQGEQYEPFDQTSETQSGESEWVSSEVLEPEEIILQGQIILQGHEFSFEELLDALNRNTILGGVSAEGLQNSLVHSDDYEYLVKSAHDFLIENGILPEGIFLPVLFLEGVDKPGLALTPRGLEIIVVGYDACENLATEDEKTNWLAIKIAHEATHVINHRENPDITPITDEYLAYEATYEVAALIYGVNSEVTEAQRKVYTAFEALANNSGEVTEIFGISTEEFKNINYSGISIQEDYVIIVLYNMQGGEERHIGIDSETGEIEEMVLK